jgi:outer membrane protein TolC
VESGVAQARAAVPVLEAALAVALNAMDVMLGLPPGAHRADFSSVGAIPVPPAMVDAGAPGQLLRRRPDLIIAERRLAASSARIGEAMAEYYPKLSLSGMLGSSTSVSTGNLFSGGASQAAGVLGLRWRLFDFGRINAQIAQAKGREAEMLSAYRLAALRATEEVENALAAWVKREEQTVALRQNMDAVSQARAASVAAYEKGVVARIDVLQVDGELWRASDAQAQAQIDTARAAVASFKALGGWGYSSDAGS